MLLYLRHFYHLNLFYQQWVVGIVILYILIDASK